MTHKYLIEMHEDIAEKMPAIYDSVFKEVL